LKLARLYVKLTRREITRKNKKMLLIFFWIT